MPQIELPRPRTTAKDATAVRIQPGSGVPDDEMLAFTRSKLSFLVNFLDER
jgi:hypothetical protein